jgi:hypothetical protein
VGHRRLTNQMRGSPGRATPAGVGEDDLPHRLADGLVAKYGEVWRFTVQDGAFLSAGGRALVFEIAPVTAYGFGKGPYSHTRWRF